MSKYRRVNGANSAAIKAYILAQGAKFQTAVFVKKDGTLRKMTFTLAAVKTHCVGSELGARMSESFHANPDNDMLIRGYEMGKKGIRTINADTVCTTRAQGETIRWRDPDEVTV